MSGLAEEPREQTQDLVVEQCLMMTQNECGDGEGGISPGRVQKMDPVKRTAGRLGFGQRD